VTPRRALSVALSVCVLVAACSDDSSSDGSRGSETDVEDVLAASADEVIVPSYETLVDELDGLASDLAALCSSPSPEALATARASWQDLAVAWRRTRAGGVGPAMDRRLASAIAFAARADAVHTLLAGTDPVDEAGVDAAGAGVKGIVALEIGLFGDGADELTAAGGARRCEYLTSVNALARAASAEVLDDWTGGYRDEFVEGMDGDAQASLDDLVNEVISRAAEVDDQGLRALTEAGSADAVPATKADGPGAFRLAELRATYDGVAAILDQGRLQELVEATNADTAERLATATAAATEAMAVLPDSVTASFDDIDALIAAQQAVMALRVLLATEVASELGVTMSFNDSDGDS
jgi:predicted lipoprotein